MVVVRRSALAIRTILSRSPGGFRAGRLWLLLFAVFVRSFVAAASCLFRFVPDLCGGSDGGVTW
ncbi:hypothetical protein MtrunA17_Chr4g0069681 [Medicago truncatula]|uniref:Transmembrane protein n=1 Tax=Medicago truncatula TaxID=3880 RepID=A0A396IIJ3_MEDTR|nr:hypothetical protein MtrunA17_Chr4g0069681 [Medicago truncatula]